MPIFFALILSLFDFEEKSIFWLEILIFPDVGESIKERIFNSVDFPEPDGPTSE